jgi:Fungal Zn(2)-Cys(6) binuclear cluster domain
MDPLGGDYPHKRARHIPPESVEEGESGGKKESRSAASSFRNVSACNRCRLRKNRCDQRLPSCASCGKAGVKCVGYDPITKREIPRRYVSVLLAFTSPCIADDEGERRGRGC